MDLIVGHNMRAGGRALLGIKKTLDGTLAHKGKNSETFLTKIKVNKGPTLLLDAA